VSDDVMFVIGLVLGGFSLTSLIAAHADHRSFRGAITIAAVAVVLVAAAVLRNPGAYSVAGIPDVFLRVIGAVLNADS
jgi:hypothetical protein